MTPEAWGLVGLLALVLILDWSIRISRRAARANRQINGDVAYLQSLPGVDR